MLPPKLELVRLELLYYPERLMGDEDSGKAIPGKTEQLRDMLDRFSDTRSTPEHRTDVGVPPRNPGPR